MCVVYMYVYIVWCMHVYMYVVYVCAHVCDVCVCTGVWYMCVHVCGVYVCIHVFGICVCTCCGICVYMCVICVWYMCGVYACVYMWKGACVGHKGQMIMSDILPSTLCLIS